MSRKSRILGLSLVGVCGFAVSQASAQFLPGNVWPNPDLSTPAAPGVDQVYSYYNTPYYTPNATGDSNPRPDGWHRGNGDFGVTGTPQYNFYNTPGNIAGEGTAPAGSTNGFALQINDTDPGNSGEWFSDFNALPAGTVAGSTVYVRFFWQYQDLHSTQKPESSDQFRVTADWGDSVGDDTLTAPNIIDHVDDIIPTGSPDVTSWTEVDEAIIAPAGAQSLRLTIDSGGSGAATGQIWVEDVSVSSVPEPTSLVGIAAGSMLMLAKRRRA
jgi:hypothetical protein